MPEEIKPPIKSGWRGNINGFVENTDTQVQVGMIDVKIDHRTAWALCNLLTDRVINESNALENDQIVSLSNLGAALGRLIDHRSANNGGREVVK